MKTDNIPTRHGWFSAGRHWGHFHPCHLSWILHSTMPPGDQRRVCLRPSRELTENLLHPAIPR